MMNAPGLVLIAALGIALQTSLFRYWPLSYIEPDTVLVMVIWLALRRNFTEGGVLTLILSDIAEIHSAAPQGLFLICYMIIYLAVRAASRILVIPNLSSYMLVVLFSSVIWKLSGLAVIHFLDSSANQWRHTLLFLFPGAIIEAVISFWFFRKLEQYDLATFKHARTEHQLEDEILLESEGF
jgi:hypothetical protein